VMHVVPSEGYGGTGVGMLGAMNSARHSALDLESELLRKGHLEGIRYGISVKKGEVWSVVSRMVEEDEIDLVVVARTAGVDSGRCCWDGSRRRSFVRPIVLC
jgi:hypothetical protein